MTVFWVWHHVFICNFCTEDFYWQLIALVNTQNVSVTKIVDSSSIQSAESEYGRRIQFLAIFVMIHEVS